MMKMNAAVDNTQTSSSIGSHPIVRIPSIHVAARRSAASPADNRPCGEIERRRFAGTEWRKLLVREPARVRDGNPVDDERKDTAEKDSHFVKRLGHASTDSISATTSL